MIKNTKENFYVAKVPGDIFKGLGWIKVEKEVAKLLKIPHQYTGTIYIPNSEPYCCPIRPDNKIPYFQFAYEPYHYIYLPNTTGASQKFSLAVQGEFIALHAQKSLTIKAVHEWVKTWANDGFNLFTPNGKLVKETGRTTADETAFVYFVFNRDSRSIKIRMAKDVAKRLKSLQTSSPVPLELITSIQVDSVKKAKELELQLHNKFAHLRMSGEWFRATPDLMNYIKICKHKLNISKPKPYRSVPLAEI